MIWPLADLPESYFQGAGRISGDPPEDLRTMLNLARLALSGGIYFVHPTLPGTHHSIEAAYDAARDEVAEGDPITIILAAGYIYPVNFELKNTHDLFITSNEGIVDVWAATRIYGTLDTEVSLGTRSRQLTFMRVGLGSGSSFSLTLDLRSGWWTQMAAGMWNACQINLWHGADGAQLRARNFTTQNYFRIHEKAPYLVASVTLDNCMFFMSPGATKTFIMDSSVWEITRSIFWWWAFSPGFAIDMQGTNAKLQWNGIHRLLAAGGFDLVGNPGGGSEMTWEGESVFTDLAVFGAGAINFGAVGTVHGSPSLNCSLAPGTNAPLGTRVRDRTGGAPTYKDLFWNGVAWV